MERLYKQYYASIKSFVAKKVDDEGVIEEIVQDVLYAAIKSEQSFEGRSSEFSWICSIAQHKIIDYYRKKKIKTILFSANPVFEDIADRALTPERDVLKNELKAEIKKTLRELGEGYEKILRLKYVDGLKVTEIAKQFKISVKAVESRLIRAKKQFRLEWNYDRQKDRKDR